MFSRIADGSTGSNYQDVYTKHIDWSIHLDLLEKRIFASATHEVCVGEGEKVSNFTLDTYMLTILGVTNLQGEKIKYEEKKQQDSQLGSLLLLTFSHDLQSGDKFTITYEIPNIESCLALHYTNEPVEYIYSYTPTIQMRSLLPCQDTPSRKITYTVTVTSMENLVPIIPCTSSTAAILDLGSMDNNAVKQYTFFQDVPVCVNQISLFFSAFEKEELGNGFHLYAAEERSLRAAAKIAPYFKSCQEQIQSFLSLPSSGKPYTMVVTSPCFPHKARYVGGDIIAINEKTLYLQEDEILYALYESFIAGTTAKVFTPSTWDDSWLHYGVNKYLLCKVHAYLYKDITELTIASISDREVAETITKKLYQRTEALSLRPESSLLHYDFCFPSVLTEKGCSLLLQLEAALPQDEDKKGESPLVSCIGRLIRREKDVHTVGEFISILQDCFPFLDFPWIQHISNTFHQQNPFVQSFLFRYNPLISRIVSNPSEWVNVTQEDLETIHNFSSLETCLFLRLLRENVSDLRLWTARTRVYNGSQPITLPHPCEALESRYGYSTNANSEVRVQWSLLAIALEHVIATPLLVSLLEKESSYSILRQLHQHMARTASFKDLGKSLFRQNVPYIHPVIRKLIAKEIRINEDGTDIQSTQGVSIRVSQKDYTSSATSLEHSFASIGGTNMSFSPQSLSPLRRMLDPSNLFNSDLSNASAPRVLGQNVVSPTARNSKPDGIAVITNENKKILLPPPPCTVPVHVKPFPHAPGTVMLGVANASLSNDVSVFKPLPYPFAVPASPYPAAGPLKPDGYMSAPSMRQFEPSPAAVPSLIPKDIPTHPIIPGSVPVHSVIKNSIPVAYPGYVPWEIRKHTQPEKKIYPVNPPQGAHTASNGSVNPFHGIMPFSTGPLGPMGGASPIPGIPMGSVHNVSPLSGHTMSNLSGIPPFPRSPLGTITGITPGQNGLSGLLEGYINGIPVLPPGTPLPAGAVPVHFPMMSSPGENKEVDWNAEVLKTNNQIIQSSKLLTGQIHHPSYDSFVDSQKHYLELLEKQKKNKIELENHSLMAKLKDFVEIPEDMNRPAVGATAL